MAGEVAFTLIADDEAARQQIEDFLENFEGRARRTNRAVRDGRSAYDEVTGAMDSYVAKATLGFLSVGTVINGVTAALREMEAQGERGKQSLMTTEDSRRAFSQLGGNAADMQRRIETGQRIAATQGIGEVQANQFLFNMASVGEEAGAESLAELFKLGSGSEKIATGAVAIRKAFGAEEAGGTRGLVNKLLAAAADSPVTAGEFAPAVTDAGTSAAAIGASDEETLAAVAQVANITQDASKAAQRIKAFSVSVERMVEQGKIAGGLGLMGSAKALREAGLDNVVEMGSSEAASGASMMLQQEGAIQATLAKITAAEAGTGTDADLLARSISEFDAASPDDVKAAELRREQVRLEQAERQKYGAGEAEVDSAIARTQRGMVESGVPQIAQVPVNAGLGVADMLVDANQSRGVGAAARAVTPEIFVRAIARLTDALERNTDRGVAVPAEGANQF